MRPGPSRPRCLVRTLPRRSSPTWPHRSWPWTTGLKRLDRQIRETFRSHPQAETIESLPGMGPILGAEFVVAAGDLSAYVDAGHLASAAGLVPVPRGSGRRAGNLHRPKRYSHRLRRVFYMSARTGIIRDGPNRDFYAKSAATTASTSRPSSPWPDDERVCSGRCCVTDGRSPPPSKSPPPTAAGPAGAAAGWPARPAGPGSAVRRSVVRRPPRWPARWSGCRRWP